MHQAQWKLHNQVVSAKRYCPSSYFSHVPTQTQEESLPTNVSANTIKKNSSFSREENNPHKQSHLTHMSIQQGNGTIVTEETSFVNLDASIEEPTTQTTMPKVSIVGIALMAVSNAVSWYLIVEESSYLSGLSSAVWKIALFYTLWALFNRYLAGRTKELGHFSFGPLFLLSLDMAKDGLLSGTKIPLLIACGLVVLNFAVVLPLIASVGTPGDFAKKMFKSDEPLVVLWGYAFCAYILSNVALWCYCWYLFQTLSLNTTEVN